MKDYRKFNIREVDRNKKCPVEDWRTPSKREIDDIYLLLIDDASSEITDRYHEGLPILVFGVPEKDYEIVAC